MWGLSFFKRKKAKEKSKKRNQRQWSKPFTRWENPQGFSKKKYQQEFLEGIISSFSILVIVSVLVAIMVR